MNTIGTYIKYIIVGEKLYIVSKTVYDAGMHTGECTYALSKLNRLSKLYFRLGIYDDFLPCADI